MTLRRSRPARTIYLKSCPRCNGDIGVSSDHYGKYIHCIQCGYMADIGRSHSRQELWARAARDIVA